VLGFTMPASFRNIEEPGEIGVDPVQLITISQKETLPVPPIQQSPAVPPT
jgi:hypothetical protein